jgi:hypothetical protein
MLLDTSCYINCCTSCCSTLPPPPQVVKKRVQDRKLKGKAPAVTVSRTEPCDSFFNFFYPPQVGDNPGLMPCLHPATALALCTNAHTLLLPSPPCAATAARLNSTSL